MLPWLPGGRPEDEDSAGRAGAAAARGGGPADARHAGGAGARGGETEAGDGPGVGGADLRAGRQVREERHQERQEGE